MYIGNYKIVKDSETAAVMLVGKHQKTGDETLKPVAYTRDLLGALLAVQRKMSVVEFDKEPDAKKLIITLERSQEETMALVKQYCTECLK